MRIVVRFARHVPLLAPEALVAWRGISSLAGGHCAGLGRARRVRGAGRRPDRPGRFAAASPGASPIVVNVVGGAERPRGRQSVCCALAPEPGWNGPARRRSGRPSANRHPRHRRAHQSHPARAGAERSTAPGVRALPDATRRAPSVARACSPTPSPRRSPGRLLRAHVGIGMSIRRRTARSAIAPCSTRVVAHHEAVAGHPSHRCSVLADGPEQCARNACEVCPDRSYAASYRRRSLHDARATRWRTSARTPHRPGALRHNSTVNATRRGPSCPAPQCRSGVETSGFLSVIDDRETPEAARMGERWRRPCQAPGRYLRNECASRRDRSGHRSPRACRRHPRPGGFARLLPA